MSKRILVFLICFLAAECALPHRGKLLPKPGVCPDEKHFGDRKWVNLDKNLCDNDADCTGRLKCCKFYGSRRCLPDASQGMQNLVSKFIQFFFNEKSLGIN